MKLPQIIYVVMMFGFSAQAFSADAYSAYYKEVDSLNFGKKLLKFREQEIAGSLSAENISKHGYVMKPEGNHRMLYSINSDAVLSLAETEKVYGEICQPGELNFYLTNLSSYKRDYKQLLAIDRRYAFIKKRSYVFPEIKSDGELNVEDFKRNILMCIYSSLIVQKNQPDVS